MREPKERVSEYTLDRKNAQINRLESRLANLSAMASRWRTEADSSEQELEEYKLLYKTRTTMYQILMGVAFILGVLVGWYL
jgi:hypothetical protein